ncbi:MAG: type VI secretion system baseplate subunit TssK [Acidobacteriota bacterium]
MDTVQTVGGSMKHLSRVVWTEGMYLGPHHFQAQNRYFEDAVQFASANLSYQPYGFLGLELDIDALRNGTLALIHARGIFPDGLAFHIPEYDALPPPRPIADAFSPMSDRLDVYLSVTPYREEGANCTLPSGDQPRLDHSAETTRYQANPTQLTDENTGRDEKPILLARKNIRFRLDQEEMGDAIQLRIARIKRDGAGQFSIDEQVIPPCLRMAASEPLLVMVRRLIEIMEEKCRVIARPKDLGSPTAAGYSAEGIANAWFLHCINSMIGPLRHLYLAKRAHPEELFRELSRLAGALCTFSLTSHPSDLPFYDHERPTECFAKLDEHIRAHLELVVPSNCVPIPLANVARYFYQGTVTDPRSFSRSRWIFGIRSNIGESNIIQLVPKLIKVCSKEFLPKLVERALPGLKLSHLPMPPPAVSPKIDVQYFAIDKSGPCWDHIVKTREVAVYCPGELPEPDLELSVVLES